MGRAKVSVPRPIQSSTASESLNKKSAVLSNSTNPQDDPDTPSSVMVDDPVYSQHQREDSEDPSSHPTYAKGWAAHGKTRSPKQASTENPSELQGSSAQSRLKQLSSQLSSQPKPTDVAPAKASPLNQLSQLSSQPKPTDAAPANTSRRKLRKKKSSENELPADYSDILAHLGRMRTIASTPDPTDRGYARQKAAGKLWVRERIEKLLVPQTWREVGSVAGTTTWRRDALNPQSEHVDSFIPSNNPQGFGLVKTPSGDRTIFLTADDFSVRAGHADGSSGPRSVFGEKLALHLKLPVVKLVDGSSGGGSVTTIKTAGYSYIPHANILIDAVKQLNQGIPNLGAAVGPAIGLGAARVVSTHFNVMAADIGSMFNAGPKVVEGATFEEGLSFSDLGGPSVHCTNGTFDNMAPNEEGCFEQIRTVLGYLPDCGALQAPPVSECVDDVNREDLALRSIIPRRKGRMYNPYTIINSVMDRDSWFEIGAMWGRTGIVGLARLGGRPVGVISLNCEVNGGALDAQGSQKMMKHIKFCDVFNLPIIQFVDVPGYAIGTVAERTGTMKWGVALAMAYYSTTTPIFSVITRRAFGVAGGVMIDCRDPIMRIAWPSGEWGSLPLDGGIEVGHRFELKQIEEKGGKAAKDAKYKELEDEYLRLMNPARTANVFGVEEIVDPKDTRSICCEWTRRMYGINMEQRMADRKASRIHPVFT